MLATMADCCEAAQTQQSNEGGGGLTRMAKCNDDEDDNDNDNDNDNDDDDDDGKVLRRRR